MGPSRTSQREILELEHERRTASRESASRRAARTAAYLTRANNGSRSTAPISMQMAPGFNIPVRGQVEPHFGFEGGPGPVCSPEQLRRLLVSCNKVALAAPLVPVLRDGRQMLSQHQAVAETEHPAAEYLGMRGQVPRNPMVVRLI